MSRGSELRAGDLAWFSASTWSWSSLGEAEEPDELVGPGTLVTVIEISAAAGAASVMMPGGQVSWVNLSCLVRVET